MGKWAVRRERDRRLGRGDQRGQRNRTGLFPSPREVKAAVLWLLTRTEPLCRRVLENFLSQALGRPLPVGLKIYDL